MEGWAMMADHGRELFAQEALPRRLGRRLAVWTRRAIELVLDWQDVARQRRALLALNERLLKDIGISRADAEREASRPFWDLAQKRWRDWR
jgi:uncharacterized protein YjiS (DUF1127 family)